MKKFLLLIVALVAVELSYAQTASGADEDSGKSTYRKEILKKRKGGLEANILFNEVGGDIEGVFNLGGILLMYRTELGTSAVNVIEKRYGYSSYEASNSRDWSLGAGLNKRWFVGTRLFFDLRLGAYYNFLLGRSTIMDVDPETGAEMANSMAPWSGFVRPVVGFNLFGGVSVTAGYNISFQEFKFTKSKMSDNFSLGLTLLM